MQKNIINEYTELRSHTDNNALHSMTSVYQAALYARISREDGDKSESDSIVNQKDLIKEFLKNMPDIKLVSEHIDDGYSGVNFDRPAFNAMISDVKKGLINCVIVKDLSRFGRNYIEAGRYVHTLFPMLNVRFIAVNDSYDSITERSLSDDYIIPFKNIINEAYCADISKKIRSQFEVKRKKGDFISAFVPFGYMKSQENKNRLIIDEIAAEAVKDIFKCKLAGMSCQNIADKFNSLGVLSPLEYKKSVGLGCSAVFKLNLKAKWSAVSIKRILCNEVYTGVLIQGKTTTPNHKSKQKVIKDKSEWARTEDAHEAIVTREDYKLVADLLGRDAYKTDVYPFSGVLFCSKCRHNLVRKVSAVGGAKYVSYACLKIRKNDKRDGCPGIRIKEEDLYRSVTAALKGHINSVLDIGETLKFVKELPQKECAGQKLSEQINIEKAEIAKIENRKIRLYEDYSDGRITQEEYAIFKRNYDSQKGEAETVIANLEYEYKRTNSGVSRDDNKWIKSFELYRSFSDWSELTRDMIVKLIDKIIVYEGGIIEIIYRYGDEYERAVTGNLTDALPLETEKGGAY